MKKTIVYKGYSATITFVKPTYVSDIFYYNIRYSFFSTVYLLPCRNINEAISWALDGIDAYIIGLNKIASSC
jgi:hypothetical protein